MESSGAKGAAFYRGNTTFWTFFLAGEYPETCSPALIACLSDSMPPGIDTDTSGPLPCRLVWVLLVHQVLGIGAFLSAALLEFCANSILYLCLWSQDWPDSHRFSLQSLLPHDKLLECSHAVGYILWDLGGESLTA